MHRHEGGRLDKGIQAAHGQGPQERQAAEGNAARYVPGAEGRGVADHHRGHIEDRKSVV